MATFMPPQLLVPHPRRHTFTRDEYSKGFRAIASPSSAVNLMRQMALLLAS